MDNKARYLFVVAVAVFSLALWGGPSYAQYSPSLSGAVQGGYAEKGWNAFEASWLIGQEVFSPVYSENLGQITDLMIDKCGRVAFVILSDTPGFGARFVAVPFDSLIRTGEDTFQVSFDGREIPFPSPSYEFYNTSGDRYAKFLAVNSSTVGLSSIPARADTAWAESVYRFYGVTPYWAEGQHPDIVSYRETSMLGADVLFKAGGMSGRIGDLVITYPHGRIAFVVLDDVPGRTGAMVAVPFGEFSVSGNVFVLNTTEDRLAAAPEFFTASALNNSRRAEEIYSFYGIAPYWAPCAGSSCGPEVMNFGAAPAWTPLPSSAKPGECYARVFVPPQFKTVTEKVMVRPASEKVEIIPAKYEVVDQQVMVKSASKKMEEVPAQYKWVDEKVLLEPAHTEWRPGRGAIERVDHATGEVMCLVEIPAKYETVKKEVLVSPATVREVEIPAQYETVKVTKMTEPPQEKHITIPAEYQTITKNMKVSDGYAEWKKVECETNQSSGAMK